MQLQETHREQGVLRRLARARALGLLLRLADRLSCGSLDLVLPDGTTRRLTGAAPGPHAVLVVHRGRVAHRYLRGGRLGFAEAYVAGDWDTPDLATLLALLSLNVEAWGNEQPSTPLRRWQRRLNHVLRPNSRTGSRRNIHAHYDLGNEFFAAWLDPSMTYSAALFGPEVRDLEQAQHAKNQALAERIGLTPGHRLLEIGCGWGGFALTAAKEFGARVTAITVSRAQAEYARARVFREGLAEQVEILLEDYRDVRGRFDRIASIEMFEAVGERFWPVFFTQLRERLAPDGRAGLQVITIADRYFEAYRRDADFIQAYIFPGGMLPASGELARQVKAAGLTVLGELRFGGSYADTLRLWNERFQAAWPSVRELGFDERFRRIWTYYLAYCEAGFRTQATDVVQTVLRPA
ncbi:MAG: cyclopropane-fatty-acyl-phospholipid synthase family protein [Geminicoccaceae bacterium]